MAETPKAIHSSAASRPAAVRDTYSSLFGANSAFLEACVQASQTYMQRLTAINEELMGFAAGRVQKNSEAGESLLKCRDIGECLRLQQEWVRGTTEQYVQEASRILEITTKTALESLNPIIERTASAKAESEELRKAS